MRYESKFNNSDDNDDDGDGANWQDSYSDLVTDLLAIFVILFAFAMMTQAIEASKVRASSSQDIISLDSEKILSNNDNILPAEDGVLPEDNFNSLYESIKEYIEEEGLSNQLQVTNFNNKQILLRVAASVFFDSGRANIDNSAEELLDKIAELLTRYKSAIKMVRIEGHTDNDPIKTKQFESNWELSTSRAVNVLRKLIEISELESAQLSAVGYSEFYPIADNETDAGRNKNRRVDFFIESAED